MDWVYIYIYIHIWFAFFWFCNPQIWERWDPFWRAYFWKRGGSTTNYSGFLLTFLWTTLVLLLMDLCISLWELTTKNLGKSLKKQGDSSPQVMAQPPHGAVFPHVWGRWIRDGGGDIQEIDCDKMLSFPVLIVEWWTPWCFFVFCESAVQFSGNRGVTMFATMRCHSFSLGESFLTTTTGWLCRGCIS